MVVRPRKILVVANDVVGRTMAGPGIRSLRLAQELAVAHEVELATPNQPDIDLPLRHAGTTTGLNRSGWERLVARHDVIVAQHLDVSTMLWLGRTRKAVIYDLYDPFVVEHLGLLAAGAPAEVARYQQGVMLQRVALATGSAFVCASERQRDLWLGSLAMLGRLDIERYRRDPSLRGLVDVVPFGLDDEGPTPSRPLHEIVPSIAPGDRVVLWAGGIWNWLDPVTVIEAVARLAPHRPNLRLVFMGGRHPNPDVPDMLMAGAARAAAERLGLAGSTVIFNDGWVPFEERGAYLAAADIGVSAHADTVEARFAFRTRIIDYLWATLPVVATEGDVLADLVAERGLGQSVEPGDVDGWASALEGLLEDRPAAEARSRISVERRAFRWSAVAQPLVRLVETVGPATPARHANLLRARDAMLRAQVSRAHRGARGALLHAARATVSSA